MAAGVPLMVAALAGASVWFSLGTLAVTQVDSRFRIVALPPLWVLAILMLAGVAAAWWLRLTRARAWPLLISLLVWLPFVPGSIPPAFLIWQGPVEGLVWTVVVVGMLRGAWSQTPASRVVSEPRLAPWLAVMVAALAYLAGARLLSDRLPNGDEPHYLIITESLLRDGDLQIQNNHEQADYVPFYGNQLAPHYVARGLNGQMYSVHAPGVAAFVSPGFALAGYSGASTMLALLAAGAAGAGWRVAWLLTASAGAAWFATVAIFLTAPFFLHAFTVFPDGPGAACVVAGLWLLVGLETGARPRRHWLALAGLALGCLPWLHTRFAILAGALGAVIALRLVMERSPDRFSRAATFLAAPVVLAAAWFAFFWTIWGTVNPSAPYGQVISMHLGNISQGLLGVLLDQQYGLWPAAPVLVIALAGLVVSGGHRRLAIELIAIAVPYLAAVTAYDMWWGGFGGPARFLIAALPLGIVPLAWAWSRGGPAMRSASLLLLVLSAAMLVSRVTVDRGAMAYAETFGADPWLDWLARSVALPVALPSLRGEHPWQSAAAWTGCAAMAGVVVALTGRWRSQGPGALFTTTSLAAAAVVMSAASATWALTGSDALAPAKSQFAFVADWSRDWQPLGLQWRPPYRATPSQLVRRLDVPALRQPSPQTGIAAAYAAPRIGAAEYEVVLEREAGPAGEIQVRVGDTDLPLERWRLGEAGTDQQPLRLRLPVAVRRMALVGDAAALSGIRKVSLQVRGFDQRARPDLPPAVRTARFGQLRAFFLDDRAYVEPAGFWTVGGATTSVVFDADDGPAAALTLRLRSGPVDTTVQVTGEGWSRLLTLGPQQHQTLTLPAAASRDQVVTIATRSMFLPAQHETGNGDYRHLGVWVDIP